MAERRVRIAVELMGEPTVDERLGFYLVEGDPTHVICKLIFPTFHEREE